MQKKVFVKGIILVLIMAMIGCTLAGCGKKNEPKEEANSIPEYEQPIKDMFEGLEKANLEKYLSIYPSFIGMSNYVSQEDLDTTMQNYIDKYGENIKITYSITSKETVDSEALADIKEKISTYYSEDTEVTEGYVLQVEATIKGDSDTQTDNGEFNVYKINGNWYVLGF